MKNPWSRLSFSLNLAVLICGLALSLGGISASYHEHVGMPGGAALGANGDILSALLSSSAVIISAGFLLILSAAFNFWTAWHLLHDRK